MKTHRYRFSGILALALLIATFSAGRADARLQVRADVRVPGGVIRLQTDGQPLRVIQRLPAPVGRRLDLRDEAPHRDRQVARRLARHTGVARDEILRLRRLGYEWTEIGMWLQLPRRAISAAQRQQSWERYLRTVRRADRDRRPARVHGDDRCAIEYRIIRR